MEVTRITDLEVETFVPVGADGDGFALRYRIGGLAALNDLDLTVWQVIERAVVWVDLTVDGAAIPPTEAALTAAGVDVSVAWAMLRALHQERRGGNLGSSPRTSPRVVSLPPPPAGT